MTLHPVVQRLGVLGSLPEYDSENDTDEHFLELWTGLSELEQTQVPLTTTDLQTLTALFPSSLGEDYYGVCFWLLEIIVKALQHLPEWPDLSGSRQTEWKDFLLTRHPGLSG